MFFYSYPYCTYFFCGYRCAGFFFFFSSRRRHTRLQGDWSSDVCSSDLAEPRTELPHGGEEARLGDRAHDREGHARDQRPAAERRRVVPRLQGRRDAVRQEHGTHRQPTGERLRQGQHVGDDLCLLVGEQRSRAPQPALHLVEDQPHAPPGAQLAHEREPLGIDRADAALALQRLDDHRRGAGRRDRVIDRRPILPRDDAHAGDEGLERLAVLRPVGGGERGEQPAVERAREGDDLGLPGPLARELERRLVRLGARIVEEHAARERPCHELLGEPLASLGAVQVGDVNEPARQGLVDSITDDGVIVAERVDRDAGHEIEVPRSVIRDELRPLPADEQRADAGIHVQQRRGGARGGLRRRGRAGHAGWAAVARTRGPADGCPSIWTSPMRAARAPARSAATAARSFTVMPSVAAPRSMSVSTSPASRAGWTAPSTCTPGTSDTNSSSAACTAAATAAAASSAFTLRGSPPSGPGAMGAITGVRPARSRLSSSDARTPAISPT